jgi:hypothetical protein
MDGELWNPFLRACTQRPCQVYQLLFLTFLSTGSG